MSLESAIQSYSTANGYPATAFYPLSCSCGSDTFHLFSDDENGGAYAICVACRLEHDLFDSREYIEDLSQNTCTCDATDLKVKIGRAFYADSKDPRSTYVGAECPACGLAGVYVDWQEP